MSALVPPAPPGALDADYQEFLTELIRRGVPENTARAYESDRRYLTAWKQLSLQASLDYPEQPDVIRRFILDHSRSLEGEGGAPALRAARQVAEAMIEAGLRRALAAPSPTTLERRIAGWKALHMWRGVDGPFDAPEIRRELRLARRALTRDRGPAPRHSPAPIDAALLEELMEAAGSGLRGLRDRAILALAFDSGGRRRSELAGLRMEDIDLSDYAAKGIVWITLLETKTLKDGRVPRLALAQPGARDLVAWLDAAQIASGPVFRRMTRGKKGMEEFGKVLEGGMSGASINVIVKRLLAAAGRDPASASAHGLRSGFLTEAARRGAPLQAAMRLSLHRSHAQAARYYDDATLEENPALGIRGKDRG